jgi:hypothetical protein
MNKVDIKETGNIRFLIEDVISSPSLSKLEIIASEIEQQHLPISPFYFKALEKFKSMGFFDENENDYVVFKATYSSISLAEDKRRYSIVFGNSDDVFAGYITSFDPDFSKRSKEIKRRLKKYRSFYKPVNGWGFMHYLDFITGSSIEWTAEDIRTLDEYKSAGLSMHSVKLMIKKGISLTDMQTAIGLPKLWVERVYGGMENVKKW